MDNIFFGHPIYIYYIYIYVDGVHAAHLCGGAQQAIGGAEEAMGEDECDDV